MKYPLLNDVTGMPQDAHEEVTLRQCHFSASVPVPWLWM